MSQSPSELTPEEKNKLRNLSPIEKQLMRLLIEINSPKLLAEDNNQRLQKNKYKDRPVDDLIKEMREIAEKAQKKYTQKSQDDNQKLKFNFNFDDDEKYQSKKPMLPEKPKLPTLKQGAQSLPTFSKYKAQAQKNLENKKRKSGAHFHFKTGSLTAKDRRRLAKLNLK